MTILFTILYWITSILFMVTSYHAFKLYKYKTLRAGVLAFIAGLIMPVTLIIFIVIIKNRGKI